MKKPVELQINNSGAWKSLGKFDAADDDYCDDILTAAAHLVDALNAATPDCKAKTLRVVIADGTQTSLMHYRSREAGWRDHEGKPT